MENEGLNDLFCSSNIWLTKFRSVRQAGHVACMGERRGADNVLMGKPGGKRPLEDPGIDGSVIVRCIFRKWDVGA